MLYGWLNGMHGIGSTKQNLLINQPYQKTAAAHTGSDGYKVICKHRWNGIGNTSRYSASLWDWLDSSELTKLHTVADPLSAMLLLSRLHVKDVIVLYFPVELYMLCPGTVRLMLRPQGFKNASSVRTAPSFYGY